MRKNIIAASGLALLAMACGTEPAAPDPPNQAEAAIDYRQELAQMDEGRRNAVFIRAIRDADFDCQHVESSAEAPAVQGNPVWTANCTGGGEYNIVIGEGGVAQVLDARAAQLVDPAANSAGQ